MEVETTTYPNFYYNGTLVASYCARSFEPEVDLIKATSWMNQVGNRCLYFHKQDVSYDYVQILKTLKASIKRKRHTYEEMCHIQSFWKAFEQGCYFNPCYQLPIAVDDFVGVRFYVNAYQAIAAVGKVMHERPPPEVILGDELLVVDVAYDETVVTEDSTLPLGAYTASVGSWENMSETVDLTGIETEEFDWEGMLLDEEFGNTPISHPE